MFYKVMKNNRVIDTLDKIVYLKWQPKHKIMVLSGIDEAQAILSSDKNKIWHEKDLYNVPVDGYDTVELVEIDEYEYEELKRMGNRTVEGIQQDFLLTLIEEGVI